MHMYVNMYIIYIYVHIIPRVPSSSSSSSPILGVSQGFMQTLQGELLNTTVYPPLYLIFTKRLGARGTGVAIACYSPIRHGISHGIMGAEISFYQADE